MLNEVVNQLRRYNMVSPSEQVICAVSGGADSMALLWCMYLLQKKMGIRLAAAHFNHGLRGEESLRDARFVRDFCRDYNIPFFEGSGEVTAGKKGLEAAARDARYAFLDSLDGKIATAHTADDNAETVLMHLVRGTGLKGLGGIAPVSGKRIRPMLTVTRRQVLAFLEEYSIPYVTDSSNLEDAFLRNRLRHHVMPLLAKENPKFAENTSQMAMRLRRDEQALLEMAEAEFTVSDLKAQTPAVRARSLEHFLKAHGVQEPESRHIALAESLVFSDNPSAKADFPGGVTVTRRYDGLCVLSEDSPLPQLVLPPEGSAEIPALNLKITVSPAQSIVNTESTFTVSVQGDLVLRPRCPGDEITLPGGTKSLKKLFIDKKIPAAQRPHIPVLSDSLGVLGVYGIGVNVNRAAAQLPAVQIQFSTL